MDINRHPLRGDVSRNSRFVGGYLQNKGHPLRGDVSRNRESLN